jgi:hypothetical protein
MSRHSAFIRVGLLVTAFSPAYVPVCAQSADLPAGPLQTRVATACLECHDSRIIQQQRLSKGAWTKEVDKMIKWGALIGPADRDGFIDYLSMNFPPDKEPEPAVRVNPSNQKKKE